MDDESTTCEFLLPGFRFHPTEEELLNFYLKTMVFGKKLRGDVITFLNIYNHDPRELPGLAKKTIVESEREWYFFVPRDRKHGSGGRPNRTTEKGFWKATGSDRKILSISDPRKMLGLKKTLVFYEGRAPRGRRTDWIMNEYRLPDTHNSPPPPMDLVLCKIYRKATSLKVLEQRAAMEAEIVKTPLSPPMSMDSISFSNQFDTTTTTTTAKASNIEITQLKTENNQEITVVWEEKYDVEPSCGAATNTSSRSSLVLPNGMGSLSELQMPPTQLNMDWTQDSFWTQFRSPWLDNFTSFFPMC